jgi:hypothetical protein
MALTEYEEHVIEALETQFHPNDAMWFERFATLPTQEPRSNIARFAPSLGCFLTGVVLLVAVRHSWFLVEMANASGISTSSIVRALCVTGCALVLASAVVLRRSVRDIPAATAAAAREPLGH